MLGGEFGLRREFRQGAMFALSYGFSLSRFLETNSAGDLLSFSKATDKRSVANAPVHLASLKGVIPILNRALDLRLAVDGGRPALRPLRKHQLTRRAGQDRLGRDCRSRVQR